MLIDYDKAVWEAVA